MTALVLLVAGAFVLAIIFGGRDDPTELDADVWVADDEERAQRLAAKTAAWRSGRGWISPEKLERLTYRGGGSYPIAVANPNAERPARRLVRRHPMRPATWE
jgi:hypothetical protein